MISPFLIFVDGTPVSARTGQTILDAIAAWRPETAASLGDDTRILTDSRGLPADPASSAVAGAIFRVVSRRQFRATDESSTE